MCTRFIFLSSVWGRGGGVANNFNNFPINFLSIFGKYTEKNLKKSNPIFLWPSFSYSYRSGGGDHTVTFNDFLHNGNFQYSNEKLRFFDSLYGGGTLCLTIWNNNLCIHFAMVM